MLEAVSLRSRTSIPVPFDDRVRIIEGRVAAIIRLEGLPARLPG